MQPIPTTRPDEGSQGRRPPAKTLRFPLDLLDEGLIEPHEVERLAPVADNFKIAVTPDMLARIDRAAGTADPVARQFLPDTRELDVLPVERADPIGDGPYTPVKGITHRYPDRVLLKPTHTCAVYCRFCFRREKVGLGEETLDASELATAIGYVRAHPAVREVILTGGDPMILSARKLGAIVRDLAGISHLDIIRFHTRVPVVDPARVTAELVAALDVDKAVVVVVHINHANEMSDPARAALRRLRKAGVMLLSQSVLLKGVNDTAEALAGLFRELIRSGVKPYYLHHGDLAEGTAHFRTTIAEGQKLMLALRGRHSGLMQPLYVLDIPGGFGKVPIGPSYLEPADGESWVVTDYRDIRHAYPPVPPQE